MKKCPFCGEKIQEDARKCRYCWEMLDGNTIRWQKSLIYLQSKVRYRFLKVIYFIFLWIVWLVVFFITQDSYNPEFDNSKSYIICNNWEEYNLETNAVSLYSDYVGYYDNQTFNRWCKESIDSDNWYKLYAYYTDWDLTGMLSTYFWTLLIMYLVTEGLRRIIYYITLWTLTPKK
jgi:hypothetical protein